MRIGSGDIKHLMMNPHSDGFKNLLIKFIKDDKPNYNALGSKIDACRTGAILEIKYIEILPDDYYSQVRIDSKEMDVFSCSIDFAKMYENKIVDFDELKSLFLTDFLRIITPIKGSKEDVYLPVIKKEFKQYYEQIQEQLFCTGLESANLVFISVESYVDEENYNRIITEKDIAKFRIKRDDETINRIKEKGLLFQTIKNYFNGKF